MTGRIALAIASLALVLALFSPSLAAPMIAPPPDIPVTGGGALWEFQSPTDGAVFRVRSNIGIDMAAPVTTSFDDRTFTYFGAWNEYLAPAPDATKFGVGDHWTDVTDTTAGFLFTGTQVRFYSSKSPWLGIAEYRVDSATPVRVDLYQSANTEQQLVFDSGPLAPGIHRVTVKNTGVKNAQSSLTRISVDRADITGGTLIPPLAP